MPPIMEISQELDDVDELLAQRESYQNESLRTRPEFSQDNKKHPTRRLSIVNNEVLHPERLLFKIQMPREEFQ